MFNHEEATKKILETMSGFQLLGIASRDRFENRDVKTLEGKDPSNLVKDFQSVIVFGEGKHKKDELNVVPETFEDHMDILVKPLEVVAYLNSLGYKSHVVHKSELDVSLVDMAVQAGVGELSPVNSLVVKNYGLTPVIQAIITEAPLVASEMPKPKSHCIGCNLCLRVCPIREEAYADGDMSKCACNKCVEVCPV
ncbi:hypothetical protein EZV73_08085 [Acidaminobacter sp. JC074]|uniref:hypothetical protein n=1 Tax=Acidaminobacter sp. JC074 TaxID=2530199 RepID=UPI001F0EE9BA|nr:hypothetical protein [Acidaminobacter sp. JC074]MCH4887527.1 hypothetical protein [Acidaminobacter sp. JC074]